MPATSSSSPAKRPVKAATVDEYLAQLDPPSRKALARLRAQIQKAAPQAEEVISYQIPTYRLHGPLVHFAVQPKHLALYVVSLDVVTALRDELGPFDVSGRTIRFTPARPIPAALVARIVKMRVAENSKRAK